jgi:integrase
MKKSDYLLNRDGRYSADVPVPVDLLKLYKRKTVTRALGTSDLREATNRLPAKVAEIRAEFAAKRETLSPSNLGALSLSIHLETDTSRKAELKKQQTILLQKMRSHQVSIPVVETATPEHLRNLIISAQQMLDAMEYHQGITNYPIHEIAEVFSNGSPSDMVAAQIKADIPEVLIPNNIKQYVKLNQNPEILSSKNITLKELCDRYMSEPKRLGKSLSTLDRNIHVFAFIQLLFGENTPIRSIRRSEELRELQDILLHLPKLFEKDPRYNNDPRGLVALIKADPSYDPEDDTQFLAAATRQDYTTRVSSLFKYAVIHDHLDSNPAVDLMTEHPRDRERVKKDIFTIEQLKRIFTPGYFEKGKKGFEWIPLLMLYHGARPNEMAQLDCEDVYIHDGVWCIDICEESKTPINGKRFGDKTVKTKEARIIPIHQKLIDLGFIDYLNSRKVTGERKLFEVFRYINNGKPMLYYQCVRSWFEGLLVKADAKSKTTTPHSFRHTFRTAAHNVIKNDYAKVIGGWSLGNGMDMRVYLHTNHIDRAVIKAELDKLTFDIF